MASSDETVEVWHARVAHARAKFAQDPHLVNDLEAGSFYDDPSYFDSLPPYAKALVVTTQQEGRDDLPVFCYVLSEGLLRKLEGIEQSDARRTALRTALAMAALSLRYMTPEHWVRPFANWTLAQCLEIAWQTDRKRPDLDLCIRHYRKAFETLPPNDPELPALDVSLSVLLRQRYAISHDSQDMAEAMAAIDRSIEHNRGHPLEGMCWASKADLFELGGDNTEAQVRAAIECYQNATRLCDQRIQAGQRNPHYAEIYQHAAAAHINLFRLTRQEDHSVTAIDLCKKAQPMYPLGSDGSDRLNVSLSLAFVARSEVMDRRICDDPLWTAFAASQIENIGIRVKLADHCNHMASQALKRCDRTTAEAHLVVAASVLADITPQTHPISSPDMEDYLYMCGRSDSLRFKVSGLKTFIERSICAFKRAIGVSRKPWKHEFAAANSLIMLCQDFFQPDDIEDALKYAKDAGEHCPPEDAELKGKCRQLEGRALALLVNVRGTVDLLKEAVEAVEAATKLIPRTSWRLAGAYHDLGMAYSSLQQFMDSRKNLSKAVNALRTAYDLLREHAADRDFSRSDIANVSNSLGVVMLQRYEAFRVQDDLTSAIKYLKRSYENMDNADPNFAFRVLNYGKARWLQYQLAPEDQTDILTEVDTLMERALNTTIAPPPNMKSMLETCRGLLSEELFLTTGVKEELDRAIRHFKEAQHLEGLPPFLEVYARSNLGISQGYKARLTRRREDFDEAFKTFQDAEALRRGNDSRQWLVLLNETSLRHDIHKLLGDEWGDSFGRQALASYVQLADDTSMATHERLQCANAAATLAYSFGQVSEACMYQVNVLQLLAELLAGATTRAEILQFARTYYQVPATAAALALAAGEPVITAIQRLESGRSFLWDRLLSQTTLVDDIARQDPDLADEFVAARSALHRQADPATRTLPASTDLIPRDVARLEREVNMKRYEDALNKIREHPGFESFLRLGNMPADMQKHAVEAPIVYVNGSPYRSDALVVTQDKVYSVPLPLFTAGNVTVHGSELLWAKEALSSREQEQREQALAKFDETMGWLWDVVAHPVLDSIDFARYKSRRAGKPRVVWVTTGWMNLFPIHAAGKCGGGPIAEQPLSVHDMVVSTYTTSIKALRYARDRSALLLANRLSLSVPARQKMLLVAMQFTPGQIELPNAVKEAKKIKSRLKKKGVECTILEHPDVRDVQVQLRQCNLAFFTCHSEADKKDPSKSAILLGPLGSSTAQRLNVSTILNTSMDNCRLVYLSSCESGATRDLGSSDEGLSIAGAFHQMGVPHVVSGMWQVDETEAFRVAEGFFAGLVEESDSGDGSGGHVDVDRVADALHISIQKRRDDRVRSILWAPFIYSGC